jgi:hypothetical protein
VNRAEARQFAVAWVVDAKALLDAGRWHAAYYLVGYAVECELKACVLSYVEKTGSIFHDKKFAEKCFTNDIEALVKGDPNLDPFQVKLIKSSNPLATAAMDYRRLFPGWTATRLRQRNFGGTSVDEVCIYPTLTTVS